MVFDLLAGHVGIALWVDALFPLYCLWFVGWVVMFLLSFVLLACPFLCAALIIDM